MKDATQTQEDKAGNIERMGKLKDLEEKHLEKIQTLLLQLNRPGSGLYKILENEMQDISSEDITYALHIINPIYQDIEFDIFDKRFHSKDMEETKGKSELIKTKIKLYGDYNKYPVFLLIGLEDGGMGYMERSFMAGPHIKLALSEIKEVLNKNDRYLTLENGVFFYNNSTIKIKQDTMLYDMILCVYNYFNGKSGEVLLDDLLKELRKIQRHKKDDDEKLLVKIRQNLTSYTMGFGKKIGSKKSDRIKIFDIRNNEKLIFTNKK